MAFRELLAKELEDKIAKEKLEFLPSGFQRLDKIVVLNLKPELLEYKEMIGKAVLGLLSDSGIKTVCNKIGGIIGKFRKPQIEILAGEEDTEVRVIEHGCKYKFDIRKIMFAKGNLSERIRIAKQVKENEVIVDMFAGIGYFSLNIGKLSKAKKIYSIEKNPVSFKYLKENLKLNHIHNVEPIHGDCREVVDRLVKQGIRADRVVMGYLPPPKEFLDWAFKIIKKQGVVHYEDIINTDKKDSEVERVVGEISEVGKKFGFKVKLLLAKRVKAYAPKLDHYVLDLEVE